MPIPIKKFREIVFQILYSKNFSDVLEDDEIISLIMEKLNVSKKNVKNALEYTKKIDEHLNEIDSLIHKSSSEYKFERISKVELTAIRLGVFEVLYNNIPKEIAISEAVRITRKFSSAEGSEFVNAILDVIFKEKNK